MADGSVNGPAPRRISDLPGMRKAAALGFIGLEPNEPCQDATGFMAGNGFSLGIAEFDDQGQCYDRAQLDRLSDTIDQLRTDERDVIFLVFVHGWKHNARSDDANLHAFEKILAETARYEAKLHQEDGRDGPPRDVYGVFVGWRGLSLYGPIIEQFTFWRRQRAGQRVSTGSVRELFGRLRHYRNHRLDQNGSPLVVIAGHSFGGMIVYLALAQSLIEAASTPTSEAAPRFADLVLLINPAIEAARYLPIHALVAGQSQSQRAPQPPVFVCVTAFNDLATQFAFPAGNLSALVLESTRGELERTCLINTIGHVRKLETHKLKGDGRGGFDLLPDSATHQSNPFWVVSATKEIINGHNGIFQEPFLRFTAGLVFAHVERSKAGGGSSPKRLHALAEFAQPFEVAQKRRWKRGG